jgi:hypothetical protein
MQVSLDAAPKVSSNIGAPGFGTETVRPLQSDIEEFNKLVGGIDQISGSSTAIADPSAGKPLEATALDTVKDGLQAASDIFTNRMSSLDRLAKLSARSESMSDLLKFQLESIKMGVELEFTGKAVSKSVQDIEQLTRQQ